MSESMYSTTEEKHLSKYKSRVERYEVKGKIIGTLDQNEGKVIHHIA